MIAATNASPYQLTHVILFLFSLSALFRVLWALANYAAPIPSLPPRGIDRGFTRLCAQELRRQRVEFAVLFKVCCALPESERNSRRKALLPHVQHPCIPRQPSAAIRLAAHGHKFHAFKIRRELYWGDHRLTNDIFVSDRKLAKHRQPFICRALVFNGTAHGYIFIPFAPIRRYAVHESYDPLCQEQKMQIGAFPYHPPAVFSPCIRVLQKKIRAKAQIYRPAGTHPILSVFVLPNGRVELRRFYDRFRVDAAPCIAFMNITVPAAVAVPMAAAPWIPSRHLPVPQPILHRLLCVLQAGFRLAFSPRLSLHALTWCPTL